MTYQNNNFFTGLEFYIDKSVIIMKLFPHSALYSMENNIIKNKRWIDGEDHTNILSK